MPYSVRKFRVLQDGPALLAIWRQGVERPTPERFNALYCERAPVTVTTWLLLHRQGNLEQVAGSLSLLKREFRFHDSMISVGINIDMVVGKEHRTLGPALLLLKTLMDEYAASGCEMLMAMPNILSAPVFQRAGYVVLGDSFRYGKILRSREKMRKIVGSSVSGLLSILIDLLVAAISLEYPLRVVYRIFGVTSTDVAFEEYAPADGPVRRRDGQQRTRSWLHWRYGLISAPGMRVCAVERRGKLVGTIIYHRNGVEALIDDIFSVGSGINAMAVLLSVFIGRMRSSGAHSISVRHYGSSSERWLFYLFGFIRREKRTLFGRSKNIRLMESFSDQQMKFSMYDGDLDL